MCKSCAPGVSLLTHAITSKLDFTNHRRNPSPIEKPIAKTETTIFKNGTVLTMKNNDFSPAEALVVRGDIILYGMRILSLYRSFLSVEALDNYP
jgi:hypothetical protein